MKTARFVHVTGVSLLLCLSLSAVESRSGGLPMRPLDPVEFKGWTNAYRMANEHMEIVVAADIGRVVHLSAPNQDNLLFLDANTTGRTARAGDPQPWVNYGGNWMWPVAQERWIELSNLDWPPPAFLNEQQWTGHAWKDDDGALHCLVEQDYSAPLNARVSRRFSLPVDAAQVTISQRIERTADSTIPVCLWNVGQIASPDRVLMPVDESSAFTNGYAGLLFPPSEGLTRMEGNVLLIKGVPGEFKVGSDSKRRWLAAQRGTTLVLTRSATNHEPEGAYPDGGCPLEVFGGSGLTQIETLSVEASLDTGDRIDNTVRVSLHEIANAEEDRAVVDAVRALVGEKE